MASYDPNTDYSDLIAAEAAKGVNANRQLLAQLEASRNAKIAAERLPYAQTAVYTSELGRPLGYYEATDRSDYINEIYDTAREQALSALESAYESALGGYDAAVHAARAAEGVLADGDFAVCVPGYHVLSSFICIPRLWPGRISCRR